MRLHSQMPSKVAAWKLVLQLLPCSFGSAATYPHNCHRIRLQQKLCHVRLQQEAVARIEEQLGLYQRAMRVAQTESSTMRVRLESQAASEESSRLEAKTGREELKRARKEWIKMKDDLDAEREAHQKLKVWNYGRSREQVTTASAWIRPAFPM